MLKKRFLSVPLSVLFIFVALTSAALAVREACAMPDPMVSTQFVYINQASTSLTISVNGTASIYGYVQITSDGRNIFLKSTLQRFSNGTWSNVASWSRTSLSSSATILDTYQVTKGIYRVATYYYVSGDGGHESGTIFSGTVRQ